MGGEYIYLAPKESSLGGGVSPKTLLYKRPGEGGGAGENTHLYNRRVGGGGPPIYYIHPPVFCLGENPRGYNGGEATKITDS